MQFMRELRIVAACKGFQQERGNVVHALEGLNLHVRAGEMLALVGPSGCGKTTLLRAIAGLEQLATGEIFLAQNRIDFLPPARRAISMSFQHPALYPQMSVRENIEFPLKLRNVPVPERKERVSAIVELTGTGELLARAPHTLSGGEQQRVALARALVVRPDLLLLDEPLANLDARTRSELRNEIWKLQRKSGVTCIFVTHDQSEAMALGDRVAVMNKGRIVQCSTPTEIYHRPENRFVAEFIGSPGINLFPTKYDGTQLQVGDTPFTSASLKTSDALRGKKQLLAAIRPEDIVISDQGIVVRVEKVDELGFEKHLHCVAGNNKFVVRTPNTGLQAGDNTRVEFRTDRWHIFDASTGERLS
jgi:multiple sugar transport system ATP-binding protein